MDTEKIPDDILKDSKLFFTFASVFWINKNFSYEDLQKIDDKDIEFDTYKDFISWYNGLFGDKK